MNKPIIVFIVLFLSRFLFSCSGLDCDGPVNIRSGNPKLITVEISDSEDPSLLVTTDLNESSSKRYDSLIFEIEFAHTESGQIIQWGGFGSAMACDPVINFDEISSIHISSNKAYAGYSAGENLINLLLSTANNYNYFSAANSFWRYELPYDILQLKLYVSPGNIDTHVFTFLIEMEDEREFTLTTDPIIVRP